MGRALYRKYRSKKLSEVIGQEHITDVLEGALKNEKISHAYLFTGPRGVGKTSVARILAHEINGFEYIGEESHLDIIEIDAASNNGVDDIRNLREKVAIAPVKGKKKVYIIDEVHMLSKPAFNALLKTLEEPPKHVVFIMATTDAHKLPATIISRSQQFTFRLVGQDAVMRHLRYIAQEEKITIDDEALEIITKKGGGSFRDSISLLDQVSGITNETGITGETIRRALGLASSEMIENLISAHRDGDLARIVDGLKGMEEIGIKPEMIAEQLIRYIVDDLGKHACLLDLADKLAGVNRASFPEIKLLVTLTSTIDAKPQTSDIDKKTDKSINKTMAVSATTDVKSIILEEKITEASDELCHKTDMIEDIAQKPETVCRKTDSLGEFRWEDVLLGVKKKSKLLHSSLEKCKYRLEGDVLKIYEKNKISFKKLNTIEFKEIISKELEKAGVGTLDIEVLACEAPFVDDVTAKIADIMGGGEEVEIGD